MRIYQIVVLAIAGILLSACQELREPTAFENDWQQYVQQFYRLHLSLSVQDDKC